MKLVLCDIHQTLLNENERFNESVVFTLKGLNSIKEIKVVLVTARILDEHSKSQLENYLTKKGIFFEICSNRLPEDVEDDVEIKLDLLNYVKEIFGDDILLAIDNNKDICKMYRKHGIDSMRFKKGK